MKGSENIFAAFHDIIPPPPVSLLPAAPGYLALLIFVLAALFPISLYLYKRHMRNLYRSDALAELSNLKNLENPDEQLLRTLQLIKRAAIVAYGRQPAAALTGPEWWQFLGRKSGHALDLELQSYCREVYLGQAKADKECNSRILAYIHRWIKKHRGVKID